MNENHRRYLQATFRNTDKLLSEADQMLSSPISASPFAQYTQVASPLQQKVIHDSIRGLREALVRAMIDLEMPRPEPVCGTLWAARGQLTLAGIALSELDPERMTGYGELTGDEARQMKSIAADLTASLERLAGYLDQGPDVDLHQRLEKLSHKQESVLPLLRELERIITAYGLVEFRGALTILLDRIQNETFEIGVFGRVSAGKSSFLNHLLGGKILPTGVTPVTSIPTRVRFGERPRATVEFAQGDPIMIDLEGDNVKPDRALLQQRLAEYTTEQQNPGNVKYVSRITVEVPAGRVPRGVTFVDTPGPGSLANNGADETAAYLPRCDLGLVLVDSGTSVVREDLLILQALFRSGAEVMMLISKADLLAPEELETTFAYARQQSVAQLGLEIRLFPISVRGEKSVLFDQWFEEQLRPLLDTYREQAAFSIHRKIEGLREAVIQTLERRLAAARGAQAGSLRSTRPGEAEAIEGVRHAYSLAQDARRAAEELVDLTQGLHEPIFDAAARDLALAWKDRPGPQSQAGKIFAEAVTRVITGHTTRLTLGLELARHQLVEAISQARQTLNIQHVVTDPLPKLAPLPMFDPSPLTRRLRLPKPPLLTLFGIGPVSNYAYLRLREPLAPELEAFLASYAQRLRLWLRTTISELREAFTVSVGPLRAQLEPDLAASRYDLQSGGLENDLETLRNWKSASPRSPTGNAGEAER